MNKIWADEAWIEYLYWQMNDKKTLKKINELIKDIERNGADVGIGHPERLRYKEVWSRHIDQKNRLTYLIKDDSILIISCKGHYEDK